MTVAELIELLKTFDPRLRVVYSYASEYALLEPNLIGVKLLKEPRPDGHVHDRFGTGDAPPKAPYLAFPGN